MSEPNTRTCRVSDLSPRDKIPYGTVLGSVVAAEDLTVKSVKLADRDKCAVTFYLVGTLFIHKDLMLEVLAL